MLNRRGFFASLGAIGLAPHVPIDEATEVVTCEGISIIVNGKRVWVFSDPNVPQTIWFSRIIPEGEDPNRWSP